MTIESGLDEFIESACCPLDMGHATGTLEAAESIRASQPGLSQQSIYAAAILGDAKAVKTHIEREPGCSVALGGPRNWDALTHLCFSRYLRLDRSRSDGFVQAARALLDAGANPNGGWFEKNHQPEPSWESVLYGAAGVAHHEGLTRLLLERGADPNDGETPYHAPETHDLSVIRALVECGKLSKESLGTILLRKTDWHDETAVVWLLEHGVDPNLSTPWGKTALHNALLSDNSLTIIRALLDHGADPNTLGDTGHGYSGVRRTSAAIAARRGRRDVLELMRQRGIRLQLAPVDELIAACTLDEADRIQQLAAPGVVAELKPEAGKLLCEFAGVGNTEGVRNLHALGLPLDATDPQGDPYFGIAPESNALHVAAWRARHDTVRFLIDQGLLVESRDGKGRTPLVLAIKACVDSYWTERRKPDSVAALLAAGASTENIAVPTGYDEVDKLLIAHSRRHT